MPFCPARRSMSDRRRILPSHDVVRRQQVRLRNLTLAEGVEAGVFLSVLFGSLRAGRSHPPIRRSGNLPRRAKGDAALSTLRQLGAVNCVTNREIGVTCDFVG